MSAVQPPSLALPAQVLDLLRCPVTQGSLHLMDALTLRGWNAGVETGAVRHLDGAPVRQRFAAALATEDGSVVYGIEDGILLLLRELGMTRDGQYLALPPSPQAATNRSVAAFYDQVGWQTVAAGHVFDDSARYEDLRPVSRDYVRACRRRVAAHLPPHGRFLLDAASGPVQYEEYRAYSANFDFRICADISIVALRAARERLGAHGVCVLCDVGNLPLRDGSIDAFVSLHTIYHLPAQEQLTAMGELWRVLQEDGKGVVVYTWGDDSLLMNLAAGFCFPLRTLKRMGRTLLPRALACRWQKRRSREAQTGRSGVATLTLHSHAHPYAWYRDEVQPMFHAALTCWRSLSTAVMKRLIHDRLGGKRLLAWVCGLEERYPRFFGRHGQYPMFLFHKRGEKGNCAA